MKIRIIFPAVLLFFSLVVFTAYSSVVVESVTSQSGIEEGDKIISYYLCSEPENVSPVDSWFDFKWAELNYGSCSDVCFNVMREGSKQSVKLKGGVWTLSVIPDMNAGYGDVYKEITAAVKEGNETLADELLSNVVGQALSDGNKSLAIWFSMRTAEEYIESVNGEAAFLCFDRALEDAEGWPEIYLKWSKGSALADAYKFNDGIPLLEEALELCSSEIVDSYILSDMGMAKYSEGKFNEAMNYNQRAYIIREKLCHDSLILAESYNNMGQTAWELGDLEGGQAYFDKAYEIVKKKAPGGLDEAACLNNFGLICYSKGDMKGAVDYFNKSLKIREVVAPDSWDTMNAYNNLSVIYYTVDDLEKSEIFCEKALNIAEKIVPGSSSVANILNTIGAIVLRRGNLKGAEEYFTRALEINRKIVPDSMEVATIYDNLGTVASTRGDLAKAEKYYRQSIAITLRDAPDDPTLATTYMNLGLVYAARNDYNEAGVYLRKSLKIIRKKAPGSLSEATCLNNLAGNLWAKGDMDGAMEMYETSLAIRREKSPGSWEVANSLNNIAALAVTVLELEKAKTALDESLELFKKIAPRSTYEASVLHNMAKLNLRKSELDGALKQFMKAQEIISMLIPDSTEEAENFHWIGVVYESKKEPLKAIEYYRKAINALESQIKRLGGGSQSTEKFSEKYEDYYKKLLRLEVEEGMENEAFHTLERYRGQALLQLLARRDLDFSKDVPEELLKRQKELQKLYGRTLNSLLGLNEEKDKDAIEKAHDELSRINLELRRNESEICNASLKLGTLKFPEPFNVEKTTALFDDGTLFLSYAVCEDKLIVFSFFNGDYSCATVDIEREHLRQITRLARTRLSDSATGTDYTDSLESLGKYLLSPFSEIIDKADRITVCPDGPLHQLPFGALMYRHNYLGLTKPVSYVSSATVLNAIRADSDSKNMTTKITAFGNPDYGKLKADERVMRELSSILNRNEISPLPSTGDEVNFISDIFPSHTEAFLGSEATESNARTIGKTVSNIHFACHGILNEVQPLESGLVLSIPEKIENAGNNGILQAWEIFEDVRINADLVTLSACETGLGKEMGGEGLIGLTRAFQYAGAKTVMSSLWSVADESTAELMKYFYKALKKGKSKDEALKQAQKKMIKSKKYNHPFYWAAFKLNGDWK